MKLYSFQKQNIEMMDHFKGRVLYADDMGLGKTITTLYWLIKKKKLKRILIVCPASIKENWREEIRSHFNKIAHVLEKSKPPRFRKMPPGIYIINYDILKGWKKKLLLFNPQAVVFDEAHYLKNKKAIRSKTSRVFARKAKYVFCLTGTPIVNRPLELFPLLSMIRPSYWDSEFFYKMKFCGPKKTFHGWDFRGASNLSLLNYRLKKSCMIRNRKKDVLKDLPKKKTSVVLFRMSNDDQKKYSNMNADTYDLLKVYKKNKDEQTRKNVLSKISILRKMSVLYKMPSVFEWIDNFLESMDEKIIVFAHHTKIVEMLHERYKKVSTIVYGKTSIKKRNINFNKFKKDPKCRLFIGNIQAAGVGWNGVVANHVAFVELDWVPGNILQAIDRIYRIGQKRNCFAYYLINKGTIDEIMCSSLQRKQKNMNVAIDGGKGEQLNIHDDVLRRLERQLERSGNV